MATGDQADMVSRLQSLLPNGWFTDDTPILSGVLNGIASALALVYGLTSYARLQTRIRTATDGFLDLISFDFFGTTLPRRSAEQDEPFRTRILVQLLLARATRAAMVNALVNLTGRTPIIFEPGRIQDTGAYDTNTMGYGVVGAYGSLALPYQAFITAFRPSGSGIPFLSGYGNPQGAYNTPSSAAYGSLEDVIGNITDADIYATIDSNKPAGTTMWTAISN